MYACILLCMENKKKYILKEKGAEIKRKKFERHNILFRVCHLF